jgi:hypothetical protein
MISQEMKEKLIEFNSRLHTLQNKVIKEAKTVNAQLIKRVQDTEDLLDDYELELDISYWLKEDDKDFVEDEDNILATHTEYLKEISLEDDKDSWCWGDTNHNIFENSDHIMSDEHHCWLYKCLYEHLTNHNGSVKKLSFDDILRIGAIWADLKVTYQYFDKE